VDPLTELGFKSLVGGFGYLFLAYGTILCGLSAVALGLFYLSFLHIYKASLQRIIDHDLSFCPFSFSYRLVCPSNYGFCILS
jgi:hypothetical protein